MFGGHGNQYSGWELFLSVRTVFLYKRIVSSARRIIFSGQDHSVAHEGIALPGQEEHVHPVQTNVFLLRKTLANIVRKSGESSQNSMTYLNDVEWSCRLMYVFIIRSCFHVLISLLSL